MSCNVVWNTTSSASRRVLPCLTPSAVAAAARRTASTRATMSRPSNRGAQRTARPYRLRFTAFGTVPILMASQHGGDEPRRQLAVILLALFFVLVQFPIVVATLTRGGPTAFDYQFPLDRKSTRLNSSHRTLSYA